MCAIFSIISQGTYRTLRAKNIGKTKVESAMNAGALCALGSLHFLGDVVNFAMVSHPNSDFELYFALFCLFLE